MLRWGPTVCAAAVQQQAPEPCCPWRHFALGRVLQQACCCSAAAAGPGACSHEWRQLQHQTTRWQRLRQAQAGLLLQAFKEVAQAPSSLASGCPPQSRCVHLLTNCI